MIVYFRSSTEIIPYYRVCNKIVVRVSNLEHNHCIGSDLMGHYPSSRKLNDETALAVKEVLSLRPNTKHVKEMIEKKYGKFVTLKDIHNFKMRMKMRYVANLKMYSFFLKHWRQH